MNILTSRKVLLKRPPQNPFTAVSSLAPSAVLEVDLVRASPVRCCSLGSIMTSWHTSASREAVMSRISSWRMVGKPPLRQQRVCSMVKVFPQTQSMGIRDGVPVGECLPVLWPFLVTLSRGENHDMLLHILVHFFDYPNPAW